MCEFDLWSFVGGFGAAFVASGVVCILLFVLGAWNGEEELNEAE